MVAVCEQFQLVRSGVFPTPATVSSVSVGAASSAASASVISAVACVAGEPFSLPVSN